MSFKWPHFENIHRYLANCQNPDLLLSKNVCITEKIDGSNLTIHIEKEEEQWKLKKLIGRNSIIWNETMEKSYETISYGSVGKIDKLPLKMKDFAVKLAKKLNYKNILISGEVFRHNPQFVSWHPFGYTNEDKTNEESNEDKSNEDKTNEDKTNEESNELKINSNLHYLTYDTYKLFVECSEKINHEELKDKLSKATDNLVFPPPLLFVGKLSQGINDLYTLMLKLSKDFEGSFIILENTNKGFKWKTGYHDEQIQISPVNKINFINKESIDAYKKLVEIFNNKPIKKIQTVKSTKIDEKNIEMKKISSDIIKAYKRELTKTEAISKIPKDKRDQLVKSISNLVIDEIKTTYKESNLSLPYSENLLEKQSLLIISSLISKEAFIE